MEERRDKNQAVWFDRAGAECVLEELTPDKLWLRSSRGSVIMGRDEVVELWGRLSLWLDTGSIFRQPEACTENTVQFASGYDLLPEE